MEFIYSYLCAARAFPLKWNRKCRDHLSGSWLSALLTFFVLSPSRLYAFLPKINNAWVCQPIDSWTLKEMERIFISLQYFIQLVKMHNLLSISMGHFDYLLWIKTNFSQAAWVPMPFSSVQFVAFLYFFVDSD